MEVKSRAIFKDDHYNDMKYLNKLMGYKGILGEYGNITFAKIRMRFMESMPKALILFEFNLRYFSFTEISYPGL